MYFTCNASLHLHANVDSARLCATRRVRGSDTQLLVEIRLLDVGTESSCGWQNAISQSLCSLAAVCRAGEPTRTEFKPLRRRRTSGAKSRPTLRCGSLCGGGWLHGTDDPVGEGEGVGHIEPDEGTAEAG